MGAFQVLALNKCEKNLSPPIQQDILLESAFDNKKNIFVPYLSNGTLGTCV